MHRGVYSGLILKHEHVLDKEVKAIILTECVFERERDRERGGEGMTVYRCYNVSKNRK